MEKEGGKINSWPKTRNPITHGKGDVFGEKKPEPDEPMQEKSFLLRGKNRTPGGKVGEGGIIRGRREAMLGKGD